MSSIEQLIQRLDHQVPMRLQFVGKGRKRELHRLVERMAELLGAKRVDRLRADMRGNMREMIAAFDPGFPGCRNRRDAARAKINEVAAAMEFRRAGRAGQNEKRFAVGFRKERK